MHDQEIFHTFEGSKDMNYSMMPAKKKEVNNAKNIDSSGLDLCKSEIPAKPGFLDQDDIFYRKSYFNPRGAGD